MLRKIFGAVQDVDGWRIRTNGELEELYQGPSIVNDIKAGRLGWLGHVERMSEERVPKKVLNYKPDGHRAVGRPKKRWIDDVSADLRKIGIRNWKRKAQDRDGWRQEVVAAAKVLHGL